MNVREMFHVKHGPARAATGAVVLAAALAACSSPEEVADKTGIAATPAAAAAVPPAPPEPAAEKVEFNDNEAKGEITRDFAYGWPAAVSAIPELAKTLTAERDKLLADQKADWQESLTALAGEDCGACMMRDQQTTWEVVADTPRFLSLSRAFYEFSGGAHGNRGTSSLVWDREAKKALEPEAFFTSEKALQDVFGPRFCKLLKVERAKRLGEDMGDDSIFPCPPVKDLTILLGAKSKTRFDRIGLIADAYVAGSYAEGQYEFTIPVSGAILKAVKPEYRSAFAPGE
jgi:hypothetical protein